jgi:hypothetical protein
VVHLNSTPRYHVTHPQTPHKAQMESEAENNGRRNSWDAFPNWQHFGGKRGVLELWDKN